MACNASKTCFIRSLTARGYSAKAQTQPASSKALEIEGTCLPNKLAVATAENCSPISRVSVLIKAGSRYEDYTNQGTAHVLRVAAGLTTKGASQLGITRNIQQLGGRLTCTSDRETVAYTLDIPRNKLEQGLQYLSDVTCKQVFYPWELSDILPRLKYELASSTQPVRAIDMLHKAAFRNGLGNSLFCPKWQIGKISNEVLSHYVNSNFTTNRTAVVGLGVNHNDIVAFAQNQITLESGEGSHVPAKYTGGELRKDKGGDMASVALGVSGAGLCNPEEALAFAVLQYALGTGPNVLYGNSNAPLAKNLSSVPEFGASAFNVSYSDNGLFGVLVTAPAENAGKAVEGALATLRSGNLSPEAITKAKNQLKAAVLYSLESGESFISDMGAQALLTGTVKSAPVIAAAIDAVNSSDVVAVAKRAAAGKLSLAAIGNLKNVPYLDQLK